MKDDRLHLIHMLQRCERIARFIEPGRDEFMQSEETQDAVIRNIEVRGEAAKRITTEFRTALGSFLARELPDLKAPG